MRCSVPNCSNDTKRTTKSHGITFHLFPKEPNLRTAWMEALGIMDWEPKDRSTICSEHFRNEDFYETRGGLRKIKNGAVPVVAQFSTDDLDAPAVLRVCRICLAMDTKMYDFKDYKLDQMFQQVTGMTLDEEDKLPQKLCWECAHRLTTSSKFRLKAIRSQDLMMNMLQTVTYITIKDVKSINRNHNHLKSCLIQKIYESDDYDMLIRDNEIIVNPEPTRKEEDEDIKEENGEHEEIHLPLEVEVKHEEMDLNHDNEIFFEEFMDGFDDDDDKKLSEVCVKKNKVKKKKLKVEKVRKKPVKKSDDDQTPSGTSNRYKTSDVKRRRTLEAIDENLFTVSNLSYEEQIAEIQKREESTSYKHAPYKCSVCFRGFMIKDRYDAHIIRHSEQSGAFECFICKTRLKTARALRKHITAQHTEQFSCKGCPFVTRNRGVAREHEKWHAGAKYQCPHCPTEFDKLTTYMGHIRIKHVSDFVCELCGYTFVSKKGIDVHKKKKHRLADKNVPLEGPYCEVCNVTFISVDAHERHLKLSSRHSSDSDPAEVSQSQPHLHVVHPADRLMRLWQTTRKSNRIRNDSQSMNTEKNGRVMRKIERRPVIHPRDPMDRERRNDNSGPVPCEQCGIQLRDLRLYAQHFRRAHPDKNRTRYPAMKTPCMCEQCGRIFQSMALLKDHMWVHTGEKRFKCDRCEKSFTQKTNLVFHMRVHSATRPTYECPLCGKHFAFFNNRRRHMFIHTGLKPFKCDTCGKCFTTAGEQRAHVEHVHLKKPWPKRARARHMQQSEGDAWQKCGLQHMED